MLFERRTWLVAIGVAIALVSVVPMPWLGVAGPLDFVVAVVGDVRAAEPHLAVDPNSQNVVHVLLRGVRVPAGARAAWWPWLAPIAVVFAVGFLAWLRRSRERLGALALPAGLLAVVAITPTAWPADLVVVVPLAAALAAREARPLWALAAIVLLSWPVQQLCGGHRWHGGLGLPLAAVLCTACAAAAARVRGGV